MKIPSDVRPWFVFDYSTFSLLVTNLFVMGWAIVDEWSLLNVMAIFWIQSVIIGWFNFWRILRLKEFSTKGVRVNKKPLGEPTEGKKYGIAFFFAFHYGLFHVVYLGFLGSFASSGIGFGRLDVIPTLICGFAFFINHWYSYRHHEQFRSEKPNIGHVMGLPYVRIFPMHLVIIIGGSVGSTPAMMILFLSLKTLADIALHQIEHHLLRFNSPPV